MLSFFRFHFFLIDLIFYDQSFSSQIQMYNKSKEKTTQQSLLSQKTANLPPAYKTTQNVFPSIKTVAKTAQPPIPKRIVSSQKLQNNQKSIEKESNRIVKKQQAPKNSLNQSKPRVNVKQKQFNNGKLSWNNLPLNILLDISQFCCAVPFDLYRLSLVCSTWRKYMECQNSAYFWRKFKATQQAHSFFEFKRCLMSQLLEIKQKRSVQFQTMFTKLFNYGSTKQNIPNKLISKLKLELQVTINKKKFSLYPYKLRNFNFSSYLYSKITELNQIKFDLYTPHNFFKDFLQISIVFYSRTFKVSHKLHYKFEPQQIADCAIRQKAFNYFLSKNLVITLFEGDQNFLYCFLQISVLELINQFRKIIKRDFQEHIDKKSKKLPMYKKLCETEFESFVEYFKYQADFQLHMSYHNSIKQIFTHCDTKVYPLEYNEKSAYFEVQIDDSFQKTSTFLLDNKMGISEKIQDLYLLDLVLKDRDRLIIVFSGKHVLIEVSSMREKQDKNNGNPSIITCSFRISKLKFQNSRAPNIILAQWLSKRQRKISLSTQDFICTLDLYFQSYKMLKLMNSCKGYELGVKKMASQTSIPKHLPTTHLCNLGDGKVKKENVLITGWNVNGLRSIQSKNELKPLIQRFQPDWICFNETKVDFEAYQKQLSKDKLYEGYSEYWNFCKISSGYSGVLVLTPHLPINVTEDFSDESIHSLQGRMLTLQYQNFYLVNVYKPNSGGQLQRLHYRVNQFDKSFNKYIKQLLCKKNVIIFGDMNVAHNPIDLAKPKANKGKACFTIQQRNSFAQLLNLQLKDSFRLLHPLQSKYTYWSYRNKSRQRNVGWRLDYILASKNLHIIQANVHNDIYGSDHCPISALIKL